MINDVRALRERWRHRRVGRKQSRGMPDAHPQGEPRTMQAEPHYADVVKEVREFLVERALACEAAGIARDRIVVDPGLGFGKTVAHNLALLRSLGDLEAAGYPVAGGNIAEVDIGTDRGPRREANSWPRASQRLYWRRLRAAPPSSACTTCAKRSTH